MKFYTNLDKFDLKLFFSYNHFYETYHNWFYLCLLPKQIKLNLLNEVSSTTKNAFQSILNVTEEFCLSMEECDYVLLPPTTIFDDPIQKFKCEVRDAIKNNKKIIIFYGSDEDSSYIIPNKMGMVFRSSGLLSEAEDNVFGLPTINLDVFSKNYISKKLFISFCGYFGSDILEYQPRITVVNKLLKEIPERCDFTINNRWGVIDDPPNLEIIPYQMIILNFFKNIRNNLYGLCVRGGGNFSFRLGEVLMMGRIPILIDTDCILPFPDLIPYDTNFIRIPIEKIDDMVNIIEKYHESHTEEELIQIQKENRLIWETYYTPSNAFVQVKSIINSHK
jgi:hypothetical protein